MPRRFSKAHFSTTRLSAFLMGNKPPIRMGGGYNDLSFSGKGRFSHKRTRNADIISQGASFLYLNGIFKSVPFHAECSDVFYKREFNVANSLKSSYAEEFFTRNSITSIENTQSETSAGFTATDKAQSETYDKSTAFNKMQSEGSNGFTETNRVLSEASDGFAAFNKMQSEPSDMFTATNDILFETSDALTAIDKALSELSCAFSSCVEHCDDYVCSVNNSRVLGRQPQAVLGKVGGLEGENPRFRVEGFPPSK